MANKPTPTLRFTSSPVVDKSGIVSRDFLKWIQDTNTRVKGALGFLGLNPNAVIVGTGKTVGGATANLTASGLLPTASLTGSIPSSQVTGFTLENVPDGIDRFAVKNGAGLKGVASVDAANLALINFADVAHLNKILDNVNDGVTYQRFTRVASGQLALPTGLINAGASTTATAAAAGVLATDAIEFSFATSPAAGYASLTVIPYVTAGTVGFFIGNPSAGGITPSAQTVNYAVIR